MRGRFASETAMHWPFCVSLLKLPLIGSGSDLTLKLKHPLELLNKWLYEVLGRTVPTQSKATQLAVALAAWATQRSVPDFNLSILLPNASEQCHIAIGQQCVVSIGQFCIVTNCYLLKRKERK
jgi:hypothetical protein